MDGLTGIGEVACVVIDEALTHVQGVGANWEDQSSEGDQVGWEAA